MRHPSILVYHHHAFHIPQFSYLLFEVIHHTSVSFTRARPRSIVCSSSPPRPSVAEPPGCSADLPESPCCLRHPYVRACRWREGRSAGHRSGALGLGIGGPRLERTCLFSLVSLVVRSVYIVVVSEAGNRCDPLCVTRHCARVDQKSTMAWL